MSENRSLQSAISNLDVSTETKEEKTFRILKRKPILEVFDIYFEKYKDSIRIKDFMELEGWTADEAREELIKIGNDE